MNIEENMEEYVEENVENSTQLEALFRAITKDRLSTVREILSDTDVPFNINGKNKKGESLLHIAVRKGNSEIVKLLLENAADVDVQDSYNLRTPLYEAVQLEKIEIIVVLLKHGSDPNCKDLEGKTPLICCFARQNMAILGLMMDYQGNLNIKDDNEMNALHHAADEGSYKMVEALIQMGMNVNEKDRQGRTALYYASQDASDDVEDTLAKIRFLVAQGLDVNVLDDRNETPLCVAARFADRKEVVRCLLLLGADPNVHASVSPLYIATVMGENEAIHLLIEHGADVGFKTADGDDLFIAALHRACEWELNVETDLDTIKVLLLRGVPLSYNENHDHNRALRKFRPTIRALERECAELRSERICESFPVTYHDLLLMDNSVFRRHLMHKKDFRASLESGGYKSRFVRFSKDIEEKYLRQVDLIKKRKDLVIVLNEALGDVLNYDIVVLISRYFTDNDLDNCFDGNNQDDS